MGLVRALVLCSAFVAAAACGGEERTPPLETATPRPTRTPAPTIVEPLPASLAMIVRGTIEGAEPDGELRAVVGGVVCGRAMPEDNGEFELWVFEESAGGFAGCRRGAEVGFEIRGRRAVEIIRLGDGGKDPVRLDLHFADDTR